MPGRILVGVDGSAGSRRALTWALEEASTRGSAVEAVMVWEGPYDVARDFYFPVDEERMAERAGARLAETLAETVPEDTPVRLAPAVVEGDPADVLCQRAEDADVLVVGSRGLSVLSELLLGSVSAACAHRSPCPVAIVPAPRRSRAARPDRPTGRIVVGVDGSPGSLHALRWAVGEAAARGATAEAVMVRPRGLGEEATEHATALLRQHVADAVDRPVRVEPALLTGDPAAVLCRRAVEADLLVVGARGQSSPEDVSLGTVSARCAHHHPGPVVIVPAGRGARKAVPAGGRRSLAS